MQENPHSSRETPTVALGPFELIRRLAQGGGGDVWLGRHSAQRILVAIKVLTSSTAQEENFRARFIEEVHAVARLDHPGIVTLVDYGHIDSKTATTSRGALIEDSPFLIMEFARWGTLPSLEPLRNFSELRRILITLLDALAHAHARGVIHRDIKPGNVLVTQNDRRDPALKLTDFGIAFAMDSSPTREKPNVRIRAGTPAYMAPEQIRGDSRNQGPWTDLYALGCLAYRLATGHTPFSRCAGDVEQLLHAHLHAVIPPLDCRFASPAGFNDWLANLLAKQPWRRYQCAAEAARALLELDEFPGPNGPPSPLPRPFDDETTADGTSTLNPLSEELATRTLQALPATTTESLVPLATDAQERQVTFGGRQSSPCPPFPPTWREAELPPKPLKLIGAGLGLFGLRQVPLTGRDRERDILWSLLESVHDQRVPAVVSLHGSAGIGKSRLAAWLVQRALELGCAEVFTATHSSFPGQHDGLPSMLSRALRCEGIADEKLYTQIRHVIDLAEPLDEPEDGDDDYLPRALVALIRPMSVGKTAAAHVHGRVQFNRQSERYAVVERLIRLKSQGRPIVLWLDDIQWAREALGLVEFLLEHKEPLPILVLLTHRDESLALRPLESQLLEMLRERDETLSLEVLPLDEEAHLELIEGMLGLEPTLAQDIQQRTSGNPLFAVQLVGDWVERGVLEIGDQGFRLRQGEKAVIPDDIHAMWRWRVNRLVDRFDEHHARRALEIAATLGEDVVTDEWRRACTLAGCEIPLGMVPLMLGRRLAIATDDGWTFSHTMLRESIERSSRDHGRWKRHHRFCAQALQDGGEDLSPIRIERIALHFLEAEELESALPLLISAAQAYQQRGDFDKALTFVERASTALDRLDASPNDQRRLELLLLTARCEYKKADLSAAEKALEQVELLFDPTTPSKARAFALRIRAQVTRHRGDMRRALTYAERASDEFRLVDDELAASYCDLLSARLHLESTGNHKRGLHLARAARDRFLEFDDKGHLAECRYIMGPLYLSLGDPARAQTAAIEARELYQLVGNRYGQAATANFHGEIARNLGLYEKAEQHYLDAVRTLETIGTRSTIVPRLNLALTMVQRGAYGSAEPLLLALTLENREGSHAVVCYANYALLVCYADDDDWNAWDKTFAHASKEQPQSGRTDQDLADLAERSGDIASSAKQLERAKTAYELALEHWLALDRKQNIENLQKKLSDVCAKLKHIEL